LIRYVSRNQSFPLLAKFESTSITLLEVALAVRSANQDEGEQYSVRHDGANYRLEN
jgi:hypothetical protein